MSVERSRRRVKEVAGLCRRLLALVLTVALLAASWQPATAAEPGLGIMAAIIVSADFGSPDVPEKASGQHSAHCACHAAAQIEPAGSMPAPEMRLVRLGAGEPARAGRSIPPPSRPPRA